LRQRKLELAHPDSRASRACGPRDRSSPIAQTMPWDPIGVNCPVKRTSASGSGTNTTRPKRDSTALVRKAASGHARPGGVVHCRHAVRVESPARVRRRHHECGTCAGCGDRLNTARCLPPEGRRWRRFRSLGSLRGSAKPWMTPRSRSSDRENHETSGMGAAQIGGAGGGSPPRRGSPPSSVPVHRENRPPIELIRLLHRSIPPRRSTRSPGTSTFFTARDRKRRGDSRTRLATVDRIGRSWLRASRARTPRRPDAPARRSVAPPGGVRSTNEARTRSADRAFVGQVDLLEVIEIDEQQAKRSRPVRRARVRTPLATARLR